MNGWQETVAGRRLVDIEGQFVNPDQVIRISRAPQPGYGDELRTRLDLVGEHYIYVSDPDITPAHIAKRLMT